MVYIYINKSDSADAVCLLGMARSDSGIIEIAKSHNAFCLRMMPGWPAQRVCMFARASHHIRDAIHCGTCCKLENIQPTGWHRCGG